MSSFIGHALIGVALAAHALHHTPSRQQYCGIMLLFIVLAISPDIDYVLYWLFSYQITPRYTHSIVYCLAISLVLLWARKRYGLACLSMPSYLLILAPLSHLVLDYAVGVHQNPIFWPISAQLITASYGVLPSAGKLSMRNYYLWRNLFVELAILLPIALFIAIPKHRISLSKGLVLLLSFCLACITGISLHH